MRYKQVNTTANSTGDAKKDLFIKCVTGDKSDNIPSVLGRCGKVMAAKYYDDPDTFKTKCESENVYNIYERNKTIIDFDCIPSNLVEAFNTEVLHVLTGC
jgi:5'-3' exonuclease